MNLKKRGLYLGLYLGLFSLCGCFSKPTLMTMESYDQVQIGTPITTVVKDNGEPYSVDNKNGSSEYKYVEKVTSGNKLIYENHYTIFVQDGNVVGKTSVQERVPAFDLIYQEDPNHQQWP
jgi:hypothetical protein